MDKGSYSILKWTFRVISIIVILVCVLFIIKYLNLSPYLVFKNGDIDLLVTAAIAAIIAAAWCIFSKPAMNKKAAVIKGAVCLITIAAAITNSYVYFRYLPKYGQVKACAIVKADYKFNNVDYIHDGNLSWYHIKDNPYLAYGYDLYWKSDEGKEGEVFFDPAGEYQITISDDFVLKTECFTSAGKKNIYIAPDGTVEMNLYFNREQNNALVEKYTANGRWSEKTEIDYFTLQPCLSAEDVKAFILEMGEKEFKGQLEEGVEKYLQHYEQVKTASMPAASELIIEFRLYCVDIGTYRNGSVTLK